MMTHPTLRRRLLPCCLLACYAASASMTVDADSGGGSDVGTVDFAISCNEDTQETMNRAVALLHNMMYVQAEGLFTKAAVAEPDCAMLHWGVAMTNFHPLWPGTTTAPEMARGAAAAERALKIGGTDAREQAYIEAAAAFYADGPESGMPARIAAWADAQKLVHERFPDDVDAAAFFALSHLAVAPKGDATLKHQREAGTLLETLHAEHGKHPAGFHYLIHAYDNPLLASKAEAVSRAYEELAPEVPHALHMPSHIFVRMGLWNETIFWNDRSARAALDSATNGVTSMHYAHAIDYEVYGYLQRGELQLAQAAVDELLAVPDHQNAFGSAYALAAAPARLVLETEDWIAASELPETLHTAVDWEQFPATVAIVHFARGIGAARAGQLERAAESEARLGEILERLEAGGESYWATQVNAQRLAVQGWIAHARGDDSEAEALLSAAADAEDSVSKSPVTPSAVLPARELYGDLLGLLGEHERAMHAYENALGVSPNRARSLRGMLASATAVGDTDKAGVYETALDDLVAAAPTTQ